MDVVLVRWPEESDRLGQLRAARVARLLIVAPRASLPEPADCLEDWIRLPADDGDMRTRVASLAARMETHEHGTQRPELDDDGIIRFRGSWISLSPLERSVALPLVERFQAVVGRENLARHAWPNRAPTRNALDAHMLRLRRRLESIGLEIKTVRSRGYLLQESRQLTDGSL